MVIIVTEDWRLRLGQQLPMPCDICLDRAPQRGVATVRVQLSQLLLELATHVGRVRRVRGDNTCGDVPERVERDIVHFRKQRAHMEVDISALQIRQRGRHVGKGLARERCHQHVMLGQEFFGIVRPQDGRRRKSFGSVEESVDVHLLFHLPVEGIRIHFENNALVRFCAAHLVDRADATTMTRLATLYHTRRIVLPHDPLCDRYRQGHIDLQVKRGQAGLALAATLSREQPNCQLSRARLFGRRLQRKLAGQLDDLHSFR
jgi:hypothetical protein